MSLKAFTAFPYGTLAGATVGAAANTRLFDATAGTPTIVTSDSNAEGTYAVECNPSAATEGCKWDTNTLGTSQTRLRYRFSIWFPSALPDHDTPCWAMHCAGPDMAGWFISGRDGHTNTFAISFDDITYFYGPSDNISADTKYEIEAHWDASVTPTVIDWTVNELAATQGTGGTSSTIAECEIGYINNARTFTARYGYMIAYTDTAAIPTIGPVKFAMLTPDTGGTATQIGTTDSMARFTSNGGGLDTTFNSADILTAISEVPPLIGSTATGVRQRTSGTGNACEIPMTSYTLLSGETVLGLRMVSPAWDSTATNTNTFGYRTWNGTTETTIFAAADRAADASTTAPAWVCRMATLADFDTQTELDALAFRIGYSGDISPVPGIHAIYAELLIAEAVGGSIPWTPPRYPTYRDPSGTPFIQRDRRDANTVATAANPLVAPLDSAWQAGGRHWHLYNDNGPDLRVSTVQRPYVSDPALLAPAGTDPLGMPTGPAGDAAAYWERRQAPQQPQRGSDPSLLGTALLENELLGSADTGKRANVPATHVARRLVPQQRTYVSPVGLLDTALLEAELLGGADTAKRADVPATHVDRREVPQQRAYLSTPGQLDTAQLENELLGGAEAGKRASVAATHAPRWWAPQQTEREALSFDAGPDSPPLTLTWGAGGRYWALYNQAGWQPDRRQVPQQRVYISDPSFYPTVPPLDPLTVAWGASGPYWLLYNTAALQVSRRLVPQQRERESDPGLLLTALLEAELLGGADDLARHRHAAVYADRREAPQQRAYDDPALLATALLEGVLLGGGDLARRTFAAALWDRRETPAQRPCGADPALYGPPPTDPLGLAAGVGGDLWRRANTPAYADRRQVPVQPPRQTVYFDAGPGQPPLTLSWGAGGNLWHLYRWHRTARSWWPPRLLFALLGDPCTIVRPTTGTTLRPGSGTTARPDTGTTEDPC